MDRLYEIGRILRRRALVSKIELCGLDRVLWIIGKHRIYRTERFQQYGFVLAQGHRRDMDMIDDVNGTEFYYDWQPGENGGHSADLARDIESCIRSGLLRRLTIPASGGKHKSIYNLTSAGRKRWSVMREKMPVMRRFDRTVRKMQGMEYDTLMTQICITYSDFDMLYIK